MNLIIFGPPGAGKGTQAYLLTKKFNLHQVSTGDLLREEIKKNSDIGKEIEKIISEGDFATDDIVNKLLQNVIIDHSYRNRIIFDGYPRNISQAKNLEKMLDKDNQVINFILYLNVSKEIIEKRILGRLTCQKCNMSFNEYFNQEEIINHSCGKDNLIKRTDDNQKAIITRYDTYMSQTKPVLNYYATKANFHEIDGSQKIDEITSKIMEILSV